MKKTIILTLLTTLLFSCNSKLEKRQSTSTLADSVQVATHYVSYDTIRLTNEAMCVVMHERFGDKITKGEIVKYIDNEGNEISPNDPRCKTNHKQDGYSFVIKDGDTIFYNADILPKFPGGNDELEAFLKRNVVYPSEMNNAHPTGRVGIQCQIRKDGTIGIVKVCRSIDPKLDVEAIKIVKALPRFTPATIQGNNVSCWFILMVPFE